MPILRTSNSVTLPPPALVPTIALVSSSVLRVGEAGTLVFRGETGDDTYAWEVLSSPAGMTAGTATAQTFTLTWTPGAAGLFTVTVGLEDGDGLTADQSVQVEVVAAPTGALSVTEIANPSGTVDLSDGALDWMAFAHTAADDLTQKSGASVLSDFALTGSTTYTRNEGIGSTPLMAWSDGDDPASASDIVSALARWEGGVGAGVSVSAGSSSTATRSLLLFFRLRASTAEAVAIRISAQFGAGTPVVLDLSMASTTHTNHCVEIVYQSATAEDLEVAIAHTGGPGAFYLRALKVVGGTGATLAADPATWTVADGDRFTGTVTLSGVSDVSTVDLVATGMPAGAVFSADGAIGTLTWTATSATPSSYVINIDALRGQELLARLTKTLSVTAAAEGPPVITAPSTWALVVGTESTLEASAASTNTGTLTLRASGLPGSAVFVAKPTTSPVSGEAIWTPIAADITTTPHTVTLTATSPSGQTSTQSIAVTVSAA